MPLHHQGTRTLYTPRLILRPFTVDDAGEMFTNWASDPEVTRYLTWQTHESPASSRLILEAWAQLYDDPAYYNWGIVYKPDDKLIGSITVHDVREISERGEVGYCIGRAYWGKGIMSEALSMVLCYGFFEVGFQRIQALHNVSNPASGRVMEKAGMQFEGTLRRYTLDNSGEFADHHIWAALKPSY